MLQLLGTGGIFFPEYRADLQSVLGDGLLQER